MSDLPHTFVRQLMSEIARLHSIPKVQVERAVGPILGMFLPGIVGSLLGHPPDATGFEIVSPEFPLKRADNNQSTNIDWLLVHRPSGLLVLFELKTAADSFDGPQLATYEAVRRRILREGGAFLLDDLHQIRRASSQQRKYDALLDAIAPFDSTLRSARRAETLLVAPRVMSLTGVDDSVIVRHFSDLPTDLVGPQSEEWSIVREALMTLDARAAQPVVAPPGALRERPSSPQPPSSLLDDSVFAQLILGNLRRSGDRRSLVCFWVGNTGLGGTPNYQVEFDDGSVQTFHHNGMPHRVPQFRASNLRGPYRFPNR